MSKRVPSPEHYTPPPSPNPVAGRGLVQANVERKLAYRAFAAGADIGASEESKRAAVADYVHATYGNKE